MAGMSEEKCAATLYSLHDFSTAASVQGSTGHWQNWQRFVVKPWPWKGQLKWLLRTSCGRVQHVVDGWRCIIIIVHFIVVGALISSQQKPRGKRHLSRGRKTSSNKHERIMICWRRVYGNLRKRNVSCTARRLSCRKAKRSLKKTPLKCKRRKTSWRRA